MNAVASRLKLSPKLDLSPLQNLDTGLAVSIHELGLTQDLIASLESWDAQYQHAQNNHGQFQTLDAERRWIQQGQQIAMHLAQQWRGELIVRLSTLETVVQQSMLRLQPEQWYSEEHARLIAKRCRIPEIARAIERLDELATEKAITPEWDDDAHEDLAKAQRLLAQTLAALPHAFLEDIAMGLSSPHSGTRVYTAIALSKHGVHALAQLQQARAVEQDQVTAQLLDLVLEPLMITKH